MGDRRVRRTHAALQGALIRLAEDRELSQISVADVAGQAGVSRSTFYDHYRDVHELAEAACTGMIDELVDVMTALGGDHGTGDPIGSLRTFFAALAEHASLYRSLLGPQGSARVIDHIRRRMSAAALTRATGGGTAAPGDPLHVPAAFIAGALVGVATDWLQRGCAHTPSEMAELTWPILSVCHFGTRAPAPRP
ncbi:TetR family transcriptional regulator [Pseudosporangium ferrugineum]|uniref:TetR family transcriptional regulator n=1 Tax=Pseudosporangium ferrugineum TaxID=439699 RepID=A0A2T0SFY7_9ACTN|nr:TetR family transcriptional regulator [Pseudosporangium ferrugineum]